MCKKEKFFAKDIDLFKCLVYTSLHVTNLQPKEKEKGQNPWFQGAL